MTKKTKHQDPLADLLVAASPETLRDLIVRLAASRPDARRESFDYLKMHVAMSPEQNINSEGEVALALWEELVPDLEELDDHGGGDYDLVDYVGDLLHELQEKLATNKVPADMRQELLAEVLPYIASGNAGLDDELYGMVYAACYVDDDWRRLAEAFEAMKGEWKISHARNIYRKLGDREKYLALRHQSLELGADFHDLATFYWETGEKEKAIVIAEQGLKQGRGRMDELRQFLAERAKESGNREEYLALQFAQATDQLTLEKYRAFNKVCTAAEWSMFQQRVLDRLGDAWASERLKIRMHRQEYAEALAVLIKQIYPANDWDGGDELQAAKELEERFPEEILKFYLSGLGNPNVNATRKEYARKAKVMAKIRRVLVDVLESEERWRTFAGKVKQDNLRRPSFQEEFARHVAGWRDL